MYHGSSSFVTLIVVSLFGRSLVFWVYSPAPLYPHSIVLFSFALGVSISYALCRMPHMLTSCTSLRAIALSLGTEYIVLFLFALGLTRYRALVRSNIAHLPLGRWSACFSLLPLPLCRIPSRLVPGGIWVVACTSHTTALPLRPQLLFSIYPPDRSEVRRT